MSKCKPTWQIPRETSQGIFQSGKSAGTVTLNCILLKRIQHFYLTGSFKTLRGIVASSGLQLCGKTMQANSLPRIRCLQTSPQSQKQASLDWFVPFWGNMCASIVLFILFFAGTTTIVWTLIWNTPKKRHQNKRGNLFGAHYAHYAKRGLLKTKTISKKCTLWPRDSFWIA